jgi:hypothetical protein
LSSSSSGISMDHNNWTILFFGFVGDDDDDEEEEMVDDCGVPSMIPDDR